MHLYPTTRLSKKAAKELKSLGVALTGDLASFLNERFAKHTTNFSDPKHLGAMVGEYYQKLGLNLLNGGTDGKQPK